MIHTDDPEQPARPLLRPDADDCTDIAFFEYEGDAFDSAEENKYCRKLGYDVFELGNGVI